MTDHPFFRRALPETKHWDMETLDLRWSNASFLFMYVWDITLSTLFLPFPFPVIPSESFQYLLNFQQSVPSFQCAYILTQLLIAITEKPMSGWKKDKMGNVWRVISDEFLYGLLPFKGEISLSHPDNLTGQTVLAINKGNSSKYIGPSLVFVLLCLSHMQTGRLQLSQLVFLKIRASQLLGVLSMSLLFSLITGDGGEWS